MKIIVNCGQRIIFATIFLFLMIPAPGNGMDVPLDHPLYASLDALRHHGLLPSLNASTKPYAYQSIAMEMLLIDRSGLAIENQIYFDEVMQYLREFMSKEKENSLLLDAHLTEESQFYGNPVFFSRLYTGAAYTFHSFTMVNRVSIDAVKDTIRYDHLERMFENRIPVDVPQAYLRYDAKRFGFLLGRTKVRWGPGEFGNLILGDHMPPLNGYLAWGRLGFLQGSTLSAKLASIDASNRYLSASRLVVRIKKNLYFSVNQSVLYAGESRSFEPYYVIPSFVFYFSTFGFSETNKDVNLLISADGEWNILNKYRLYFEFLSDDFQTDPDAKSMSTQNAIAWIFGLDCPELFPGTGAGVELTRINSYVYKNMGGAPVHYIANRHGGVIGHQLGPDAEALTLRSYRRWSQHLDSELRYTLTRRGNLNSVYGAWDAFGKADDPIPHGIVESEHCLTGEAGFINYKGISLTGNVGYRWVTNNNNVLGNDESGFVGRVSIDLYYDKLVQWGTRETLLQ